MSIFSDLMALSLFCLVLIPSILVVSGAWLILGKDRVEQIRLFPLILLAAIAFSLGLLILLILTNPYGREINSSLPAIGMLPVLVALLVRSITRSEEIARLWASHKALLAALILVILALLGLLWLVEHTTFYIVVALTAALSIAWMVGVRLGMISITILSLVSVGFLIFAGGGAFYATGPDDPAWLRSALQVTLVIMILVTIFLPVALIYASLRNGTPLAWRRLVWPMALVLILVAGAAYPVYWDGIWSAAHARAFEDHLPFNQFLLSLVAGVLLAISLRGWRRLAGPAYVFLVSVVTTLALIWGWNVSAFELTDRRAAQVDQALVHFHHETGRYPSNLDELTPRYLLYLPPPVVVRQGGWCYQGGQDYYRLGYVSGQFTYFEKTFQVNLFSKAGEPPPGSWSCDQIVAKLESGELNY